jgi:hypothetical protein
VSNWRIWPLALVAAVACIVGARGQNLDEGKTGPQLFALDCVACHRSPQGLAKNYNGWSLTSFLRQHYTSSSGSAGVLAAYLTSSANARAADQKKGKDDRQAKQTAPKDQPAQPAAQPSAQQPGQQPPRKQREAVRPGEPGAPGTEVPGRASRKNRREAETVPMPPPEPTASVAATGTTPEPEAGSNPFAAGSAAVISAAQSAVSATGAQPGFGDPLP